MVYLISGLGADERVFQFLNLAGIEHRFIKWNVPEKKENLTSYCERLIAQIDINKEIILIGISFGGIVAQEISKIISCKKIIIISSIKSESEFDWPIKVARKLQIHRIAPLWFLTFANRITADYYFGVENKEESKLLHQIIKDTDPKFLVWAIDQIMNWKNEKVAEHIFHIHGTNDRIFPIKNIQICIEIPNGGHFMIVNKAPQIEQLIFDIIT